MKPILTIFALIALAGCMRSPEPSAPIVVLLSDNGLVERTPDSCGAMAISSLIGQPEGMIRTIPMSHAYRVIPLGAIVTQEYNAQRVDFYLDENNLIGRISCG